MGRRFPLEQFQMLVYRYDEWRTNRVRVQRGRGRTTDQYWRLIREWEYSMRGKCGLNKFCYVRKRMDPVESHPEIGKLEVKEEKR
uniref:Uncharacterized protein n=1 Tax=Cucumis melo TaxID=3656 RepID=A0A9I9EGN1_CUCME